MTIVQIAWLGGFMNEGAINMEHDKKMKKMKSLYKNKMWDTISQQMCTHVIRSNQ